MMQAKDTVGQPICPVMVKTVAGSPESASEGTGDTSGVGASQKNGMPYVCLPGPRPFAMRKSYRMSRSTPMRAAMSAAVELVVLKTFPFRSTSSSIMLANSITSTP